MSPSALPKTRLSARALCFLALHRAKGNCNNCDWMEFQGPLDTSLLRQAISSALGRHPRAQSRIVRRWPFYYWVQDPSLPVTFKEYSLDYGQEAEARQFLLDLMERETVDPFLGRPVAFHYVTWKEKSFLLILSSHLVSDGHSCYRMSFDVLNDYGCLFNKHPISHDPIDYGGPSSDQDLFLGQFPWWKKLALILQALGKILGELFSRDHGLSPHPQATQMVQSKPSSLLTQWEFSKDLTQKLIQTARSEGKTVHCLLVEALWVALQNRVGKNGHFKIMDTVTLRPFSQRSIHDLYDLLIVPYPMRINPRWSLAQNAQLIQETIKILKKEGVYVELIRQKIYALSVNLLPQFVLPGVLRLLAKFIIKSNIILTNTGPIPYPLPPQDFPVPLLHYFCFTVCLPPGRLALIFSTRMERLQVNLISDDQFFPFGLEKDFALPFEDYLSKRCNLFQKNDREVP